MTNHHGEPAPLVAFGGKAELLKASRSVVRAAIR
jgi:hypothetical protein